MKPLFKQSIDPAKSLIIVDEFGNPVQLTVENLLKVISQISLDSLSISGPLTLGGNSMVSGDLIVQGTTISNWDSTAKQTIYKLLSGGLVSRYNIMATSVECDLSGGLSFNLSDIPVGAIIIGGAVYIRSEVTFDAPSTLDIDYAGGFTGVLATGLSGVADETSSTLLAGTDRTTVTAPVTVDFSATPGNITSGTAVVVVYYEVIPGIV